MASPPGSLYFFVIHNSRHVTEDQFEQLVTITRTLYVDIKKTVQSRRTYFGVITFSDTATFTLDPFQQNKEGLPKHFKDLRPAGNGTNISGAIFWVRDYIIKTRWQRPYDLSPPIMFILTGDIPSDVQAARVESLKAQTEGMILSVLGLENVNRSAYVDIASRPEYINVLDTGQPHDNITQKTLQALSIHEQGLFHDVVTSIPLCDVIFVLCNSETMDRKKFQDMKLITRHLVNTLNHADISKENASSVGLMTYSDRPRIVRRLTVMADIENVSLEVNGIEQTGKGDDLRTALWLLDGMFGWYTGNNLKRPNLGVVFVSTDLDLNNETVSMADHVKSRGVPLMVIGLGTVCRDTLTHIASNVNVFLHHDTSVKDTVKRVTDSFKKAAVLPGFDSCSQLFLDMVFVVDVVPEHLPYVVEAVTERLASMDLASARICLVTYDPDPTIQRSFRAIGSRQRLLNIKIILQELEVQNDVDVNMTDTMLFLMEQVFTRNNNERPEAPNVAIIITDKRREKSLGADEALKASRDAGIHMIVVGVGLDDSSIRWLASDPRGVVTAPSVLTLKDVLKTAHHFLCPVVCSRSSMHYKGMCYEFQMRWTLSWQTSKKICRDTGHKLPVIISPDIEDFIRATFFYWPGSFFLGLVKTSVGRSVPVGDFRWMDGKPLVYSYWARNSSVGGVSQQPDGGFLELCHLAAADGWHDIGCAKVTKVQTTVVCVSEAGNHRTHMQVPHIQKVGVSMNSENTSMINGLAMPDYKLEYTYQCDNGELTSRHFLCNGFPDCTDGSDEQNCVDVRTVSGRACTADEFPCDNGRCVSYNLYCDYWDDCGDNSDEDACVRVSCDSSFMKCDNGQCVSKHARCDLIQDCADWSDEKSCETCSLTQETCYDGTCIPRMWLKDGITDCAGMEGEDEWQLGGKTTEKLNERLLWWHTSNCSFDNNRCLSVPDGFGRYVLFQGVTRRERPTYGDYEHCENSTCGPGEYKCPNSYCILSINVCDGKQDCPYGHDEHNCDELYCPTYFRCRGATRCIHPVQVCDGRADCPLADDERLCNDRCGSNQDCREGIVSLKPEVNINPSQFVLRTVTKLDVSGINISQGRLNLSDPLYLGHLNMSKCSLRGIANDMETLENLVELDLSYNLIRVILKKKFRRNRRLKVINLSHNQLLVDINPYSFQQNVKLEVLYLNNCNIKHLLAHTFCGLSSMAYLDLSFNAIIRIDNDAFMSLTSLKRLELKGNPISEFSVDVFNGLNNLEFLTVDKYIFCCDIVKPVTVSPTNCQAPRNSLSSCEDLLQKDVLRVFIWVLGVMALVGNVFVFLYRIICDRASLRRAYGIFLLSLSTSDFLMGIYLIIVANADLQFRGNYIWHDSAWRSGWLCQTAGFISTLSSEASAIFICLVTFDRLLAIKYPFRQIGFSRTSISMTTISAWLVAFILAVIPLLPWSAFWQLYGQNGACLPLPLTSERLLGWQYSTAIFIGFNLVTFILIAVGQYLIYRYMREGSIVKTQDRRSKEMGVARKLSLVVITDFLCWFPVCMMGLLALNGTQISGEVYAWTAVFVLPVNSAINPILYTIPSITDKIRSLCVGRTATQRHLTVKATASYSTRGSNVGTATGQSQM